MVHERCDRAGRGAELREVLSRFATGGGVYDPLFMGAGPMQNGTLNPERIKRNITPQDFAALYQQDPAGT